MITVFPGASVSADPSALMEFEFPDPDDRHVAAAGLAAGAHTLVTANTKDLPNTLMDQLGLAVLVSLQLAGAVRFASGARALLG